MKNALVILIGLVIAGTAGTQVYRLMDSLEPMITDQAQYQSSTFSSATMGSTPITLGLQGAAASAPEYTDYKDGVIGQGKKIVLYFRSPEDGSSVQSDRELISLYSSGTAAVSTYRVEYETSGMLRRTYNVRRPNTFVLLDENGIIEQSATDPAPEILEALAR